MTTNQTSLYKFVQLPRWVPHFSTIARKMRGLEQWLGLSNLEDERWLIFDPHKDDPMLGLSFLMQMAFAAGIPTKVVAVTDGCMGFCTRDASLTLVKDREKRELNALRALGLENPEKHVDFWPFPDLKTVQCSGRFLAEEGDPVLECDPKHTGLQTFMVHALRSFKPTKVFSATGTDLHTCHWIIDINLRISLFHAIGDIWPRLGKPISLPELYYYPVYCDFGEGNLPTHGVRGSDELFERKLESLACFTGDADDSASQKQIGELINGVRDDPPYEVLRKAKFDLYRASRYASMFPQG